MMDQSVTRRGQPCWFRVESVNYIAINDSFMLEGAIYFLLKKHFRSEPYYVHLLELFHDVSGHLAATYLARAHGAEGRNGGLIRLCRRRSRRRSGSSLT